MLTLIQHPLTVNSEIARWFLDYKQLQYEAHNIPLQSYLISPLMTQRSSFQPTLNDDESQIHGITGILHYTDAQYPEYPLIPAVPAERQRVIQLSRKTAILAQFVEMWIIDELARAGLLAEILLDETTSARTALTLLDKFYRLGLKAGDRLNRKDLDLRHEIVQGMDELAASFNVQPNQYVLETFSAADIFLASTLAPLFGTLDSPWEGLYTLTVCESMREFREQLMAHPLALYTVRLYGQERQSKVDWHGVWGK